MRNRSWLVALAAALLLLPSASAAPGLLSESLTVLGNAQVEADAAALFALADADGLAWEVEAAHVVLVRSYAEYHAAGSPLHDGYVVRRDGAWQSETQTFQDARLVGVSARTLGALLLRAQPGDATVSALSGTVLKAHSETDPTFDQGPPVVESSDDTDPRIHERMAGDYLNLTITDGVVEVRGDFALDVRHLDYTVTTADDARTYRTGDYETTGAGPVATGRDENHHLLLEGAVLRLTPRAPTYVYAEEAVLVADGRLEARDATGELDLDGATRDGGTVRWSGHVDLRLAPVEGRLGIAAAPEREGLATSGALIGAPVHLPWIAGALATASALAVGALVVVGRRRERGDDLELAILAMDEQRWGDALPRLTRALRRRPHDPLILLDKALCLEHVGRLRDAARDYEAALRQAPSNAETHYYYARALAKMREDEPARVHLEAALKLDPRLEEMAMREDAFHLSS